MRPVRIFAALAVLATGAPATAQEGCFGAGVPLFHCQAGGKTLDLCLQGEVMLYRFGPRGQAAELLLARHVIGVGMVPWNGIGRYLWEEVTVYNGTFDYTVHYSIDRLAQGAPVVTGGVTVTEGDRTLADLSCDAGSVSISDLYPVFEAKEAGGQCWDTGAFEWRPY